MQVPEAGPGCPEGTSGSPSWGEGVVLLVPTWALSCRHACEGPCRLMGDGCDMSTCPGAPEAVAQPT